MTARDEESRFEHLSSGASGVSGEHPVRTALLSVAAIVALAASPAAQEPPCAITGDVHALLHPFLCAMGEPIHAGDPPGNALTIVATNGDVIAGLRLGLPEAERLMLDVLGAWMADKPSARFASVHVFYDVDDGIRCSAPHGFDGCEGLATAMTRGDAEPVVTFYHLLSR